MRAALASVALAACVPGNYAWPGTSGGAAQNTGGAEASGAAAPADTPPPSADLAVTGAARALMQLTTTPAEESRPMASPDGRTILFTSTADQITDGQDTGNVAEETISAIRTDGRGLAVYSSRRAFAYGQTWLGERGLAYVSNAMGAYQIVRASRLVPNAATTVVVRADSAPQPASLSASRDGKLIAFNTTQGDQTMVATVHPDGSELTMIAPGFNARISPDGGRVAFTRLVDGTNRIFISAADGGEETQVTDGSMSCEVPAWSPDQSWLVISCNGGWQRFPEPASADTVRNLYVVRPDGTELTQLTDGARLTEWPDWSADGTIVFDSNQSGNRDLWKLTPVLPK
jgi:Tol biopolymer transport system component